MANRETKVRWSLLVIYSLGSAFTAPILVNASKALAEIIVPIAWPLAVPMRYLIGGALLACAWSVLRPQRGHFKSGCWLRYPPLLLTVPLSGGICVGLALISELFLVSRADSGARDIWWATAWASVCFSVLAAALLCRPQRTVRKKETADFNDDFALLPSSIKKDEQNNVERAKAVLAWANTESPISVRSHDLFDAQERAMRILDALSTKRSGQKTADFCQTVVIQGPFGSGKSSVVELVCKEAQRRERNDLVFVKLNCWGFEPSTRVVEYVLAKCVDALHEYVDCTSLRSAPIAYARAIAANANSWITSLAGVCQGERSPSDQIRRFGPLLAAADLHLVAVIEDTDRNGQNFDAGQIEALLYQFRGVGRMSFILSAGETSRIEFPKIAEHIEFLPIVPKEQVLAVLDTLRATYLSETDWIDPVGYGESQRQSSRNRVDSLRGEAQTDDLSLRMFGSTYSSWPYAVARLLETPRALKLVARSYANTWTKMKGEVDIDELLMVLVLRHAAPGVFSFLGRNLSRLRSLGKGRNTGEEQDKAQIEELRADWKAIVAAGHFHADSALMILVELVPHAGTLLGLKHFNHGNRVQSLRDYEGPDYWGRLTSEALPRDALRDQVVISAMVAVTRTSHGAADLAKLIMGRPEAGALVGFFAQNSSLATGNEEVIQSALLDQIREKYGNCANDRLPAYAALGWNVLSRFSNNDARLIPWLFRELNACFPNNLRLACELSADLGRTNPKVRQELVRLARINFGNQKGWKLAAALDPSHPWTLYDLMFAFGEKPPEIMLTRGADWTFLVPVILDGMETHPEVVGLSATRTFFESGSPEVDLENLGFRENDVTDYFGDKTPRFYRLVTTINPDKFLGTQWHGFLIRAIDCAKKHLNETQKWDLDKDS